MSEHRRFPLFSLPQLVLKEVVLSFDVISRLNASLCSKKSKSIAASCKMPHLEVSMCLYESSKNTMKVTQVNRYPELETSHILNVIPTDSKEDIRKVTQTSEFAWEFYHDPSVNLTAIICNRLLELYGLSSLKSVIFQKDVEQSDFDKFPVLLPNAERISIQKKEITQKDLDILFMNHDNVQSFCLRHPYPQGYKTWKARNLWLKGGLPKIESLLEMDYEKLVCRQSFYKTSEINRFLKHWLQSTNCGNHRYFKREIRLFRVENDSNMLEDLPVTPWNPKQRGQFFHFRNPYFNAAIDCSKGFDLLRDDGVLATVMPSDDAFTFNIWNERFPDIPKKDFYSESCIFPNLVHY
ncbi:hypothetical protein CRE_13350 [Caenorhabditis remanei]|uniref:F-box domain-containing protein n=1 Tax=Caenorhabditis remanei TaxID=31234 RepID=E3M8B9_CAERE|nr:hypothetical protein CRE_13350 [Caenorhabditis remanei]